MCARENGIDGAAAMMWREGAWREGAWREMRDSWENGDIEFFLVERKKKERNVMKEKKLFM